MFYMWKSLREDGDVALGALTSNVLALATPIITLQLFDRVVSSGGYSTLLALSAGLAVVIVLEAGTRIAMVSLMSARSADFERANTDSILARLFDADGAREEAGVHLERVEALGKLREVRYGEPATALIDAPFCLIFIALLAVLSPMIALAVFGLCLLALGLSRYNRRGLDQLQAESNARQARRYSFIIETLRNIEAVKSMGVEPFMIRRYERLLRSNAASTAAVTVREQRAQGSAGAVAQVTPIAVAGVGAFEVMGQNLTVGALAASILLAGRIMQPMMRLDAAFSVAKDANRRKAELDSLAAHSRRQAPLAAPQILRSVQLEAVTAAFSEQAPPVFEDMGLRVEVGDCISVRGASGSGKTLLLHLLMGWVEPRRGRLRVNDSRRPSDQHGFGCVYVPTRPRLIDGTVLENMTRFQPERHMAEAMELADELGIGRYFSRHPVGLSLRCGGGVAHGLPKSVEQRIPLISALVGQPGVLLFDEANSLLDFESDTLLLECLKRRKGRLGMVLVTQRPSYCAIAERRLVIEDRHLAPDPQTYAIPKAQEARAS